MSESKTRAALRELVLGSAPPASLAALDPTLVTRVATEQGLSGVLFDALEPALARGEIGWGEPLLPPLKAQRRGGLVRGLGQIALAARVLALLRERGIRALPLKGVVLAQTVYDLESERPMADVDLLALERWPHAVEALTAAGYEEVTRADHASVLRDPAGQILELHRSITTAPGLFPLDGEGLWARRRAGIRQLPVLPSSEDLLVQLALHAAFQHGLVLRLVQWLDFRRLLERDAPDPERVWSLAADARAQPSLAAALLVAAVVAGAPLTPRDRARALASLPGGLRRWLLPRLDSPLIFVEGPAQLARVRLLLLAGRRVELLRRTLLLPETPAGDKRLVPRLAHAGARLLRLLPSLRGVQV